MILAICASGSQSISAVASLPATRSNAWAISPTVVVIAGRFTAVRAPHCPALAVAARRMPRTVLPGDESATGVSGATGQRARSPASGSRSMPDRKLDAAAFGRPGRTLTVIRRTLRPCTKPLRV